MCGWLCVCMSKRVWRCVFKCEQSSFDPPWPHLDLNTGPKKSAIFSEFMDNFLRQFENIYSDLDMNTDLLGQYEYVIMGHNVHVYSPSSPVNMSGRSWSYWAPAAASGPSHDSHSIHHKSGNGSSARAREKQSEKMHEEYKEQITARK